MTYKCEKCDKEFSTRRKLIGHLGVHREGGRYSVSRKKPEYDKVYNCLNCNKEMPHRHQTLNKYCSSKCHQEWEYKNINLPNFLKGDFTNPGRPFISKYLTETHGRKCNSCKLEYWMDKPIPLDVDHVDGNPKNNHPNNLQFLCPNCHRQTDTWGMKAGRRKLKDKGIHGRKILGL